MDNMDSYEGKDAASVAETTKKDRGFMGRALDALRAHKAAAGATLAAAAGVAALVFATSSAAVATGLNVTDSSYPTGTTAIADVATDESYKLYPTGNIETSYNTTEFAGRLWADKTVYAPDDGKGNLGTTVTLDLAPLADGSPHDLDPDDKGAVPAGKYEVDKTDSGTFLTEISLLSSSIETELYEPTPLDIVLVLDVSGSMGENGYISYNAFTEEEMMGITEGGSSLGSNVYFKNKTGTNGGYTVKAGWEGYILISKSPDGSDSQKVPYISKGGDLYILIREDSVVTDRDQLGEYDYWYYSTNNGSTWSSSPYYFMYTLLYHRTTRFKIDDLHDAAGEFIATIAQNNSDLAANGFGTDKMSTIGIVKFSGVYSTGNYTDPSYKINDTNNSKTEIMAPLKVYTNDGSTEGTTAVGGIKNKVENLTHGGGTSADNALLLADGVLKGKGYYTNESQTEPGHRAGVQQVVVFFTDGNPKHDVGNAPHDFSGITAEKTLAQAAALKQDGVIIYSVAVLDGADANDTTTMNANIYLNGVSSNYPNAYSENGVENTGNNVYGTNTGTNVPANLDPIYYSPSALSWDPHLGERSEAYSLTLDTTVQDGKTYYVREGAGTVAEPYIYTPVNNPSNANISRYYEQTNYYLVVGGDTSISDAFRKILGEITQGGGGSGSATGRDGNTAVTITDYLGDYMEFKGIDGILYGTESSTTKFYAPGTQRAYHDQAQAQRDDRSATESVYFMTAEVPSALLNSSAGSNLSKITIRVTRSTDAKTGDIVTITIPPDLIPSLRYSVKQQLSKGSGSVLSTQVTRSSVDPLRIFYSVGPKATTLSNVISKLESQALSDPDAVNESDKQTEAYSTFVENAANDGHDDVYPLYSNEKPTAGTNANPSYNTANTPEGENPAAGTTTVTMTLSDTNPYYFYLLDETLYVKTGETTYESATPDNYTEGETRLYVDHTVWTVGETIEAHNYIEWTGTPSYNSIKGTYYIPAGTVKTMPGDYTSVKLDKGTGNNTDTAKNYTISIFDGTREDENQNKIATMYLGNNGRLDIPVYGTLSVKKNFHVDTGYNLPENATASFTITLLDKNGDPLEGEFVAIIRDSQGHPVDHETHAIVNTSEAAEFKISNQSPKNTFTLRANETLRVTGLPHLSTYKVVETAAQGYEATVKNNDNSEQKFTRGSASETKDPTP